MNDTWAREPGTESRTLADRKARRARQARVRLRGGRRAQAAAAAASILAVLAVGTMPAVAAPSTPGRPAAAGGQPRFSVSIPPWTGLGTLDVRNAVTGKITHIIKLPIRSAFTWNSLSAESTGSFVATIESGPARLYRIRPSADGTSARVTRIATIRNVIIEGSAISQSGTWFGYVDLYTPRRAPSAEYVRLQNLHTGKIYSWTVPQDYTIGSLSIDAAGNTLAVSAYEYLGHGKTRTALIQHT